MNSVPPHYTLDRAFAAAGSPVEASEAHGCLAGSLCAIAAYRFEHWLVEVLPDEEDSVDDALLAQLQEVFHGTAQALGGQEMTFAPLLPDDETALPVRVRALADWCAGFLYGLGAARLPPLEQIPGAVGEVLKDLTELTRASDAMPAPEELAAAEDDYIELVEYVRAGVQLVYEELAELRDRALAQGGLPPDEPAAH